MASKTRIALASDEPAGNQLPPVRAHVLEVALTTEVIRKSLSGKRITCVRKRPRQGSASGGRRFVRRSSDWPAED